MYDTEELNEIQVQAVLDTEGAVLVTAGAGSGKTRLLTHRIQHLINDLGVKPYNILAITFTNKAANEMRSRLDAGYTDDGIWICTFHAACVRILRRFIDRIGFDKSFTIYGEAETKSLIKRIVKDSGINDDSIKHIISAISDAKNKGISPEDYGGVYKFRSDGEEIATVYSAYQRALKSNNALDYDDLLIQTLLLLKSSAEAREFYQNKFRYIHIDEFQDTNTIQYDIVKILAGKYGNIFAVGDEDQCIYTWRGASIANIFDFQKDFACKVYKLEQNYRSTTNILAVANKIIKGNTQRLDKKLWTQNPDGDKVVCFGAATDGFEADYVVRMIYELVSEHGYNYSDCAVLMRINALTRPFEERFLQYGIPHRVYGGFKFYDRKEIKDVLAYARVAVNPADNEAAYRIINFPRRAIGEASVEKLREYARSTGRSVYDIVTNLDGAPFNAALKQKLEGFGRTLAAVKKAADGDVLEFFKYLLYIVLDVADLFKDDGDDRTRIENLNELINSVKDFAKINENATVYDFLQMVSLYTDTDDIKSDDVVTIATVHSAKGLEFPVVFVVGLEDGIFPSVRVDECGADRMEEERRLMYVAVTRAKRKLYLTYAKSRYLYGESHFGIPSRFLTESGLVEKQEVPLTYRSAARYDRMDDFVKDTAHTSSSDAFDKGEYKSSYTSDYGKPKQKPSGMAADEKKQLAVGVRVLHRRLGKGTVIGIEKMGENLYAKIDFDRGGVMLLAADFAPVTIIDEE